MAGRRDRTHPRVPARLSRRRPYDGAVNPRPSAARHVLAAAVALFVAGAGAVLAVPASAAVAPLVEVELTAVTVTGAEPTDEVEVRGRVTNPSGAQVYGLRMAMWRSRDPIDDLAALRQAATETAPRGFILGDGYDTLFAQDEVFPAGATVDFVLTATLDDLGFDTPDCAYMVGARALGTTDGGIGFGNVGQDVTVATVPGGQPVPVTRLVVLTAPPTKLTTNLFGNDELASQLRGRLATLLAAAEAPGMSWVVDPGLYDEVVDMANGYQVQAGDTVQPGTGQTVAVDWLARFQALDRRAGARTLFALPDLAGAELAGQPDVLSRALATTGQVSRLTDLPLVVIPTAGVYSTPPAGAGQALVLATNLATAGALQPAPDGRELLASAVSLGSGQPDFDATQLVLAETLVAGDAGQLRVIREPGDLDADRATTSEWMAPRVLADLLTTEPTRTTAEFTVATPATLSADQFAAIAELEEDFKAYAELAPESRIADEAPAVLTRAASTAWISDPAGQEDLLTAFDDLVGAAAMARAVTLDATPRFVMSARSNQFPVTLTNNLTEPIRVKVVVTSDNPQRLSVPDTPVISIPPGQSETVTIQPEATANGVAVAEAWVATEAGKRVTPSTPITIEMTELGFIGWVIVIVSGLVVIGATVLRLWQVRRKAAADATPPAEVGTDLTPGADTPEPAPSVEHQHG